MVSSVHRVGGAIRLTEEGTQISLAVESVRAASYDPVMAANFDGDDWGRSAWTAVAATLRRWPSTQTTAVRKREEINRMSATLRLMHKAIGAEVRRGTYDVVVDGQRVGSVEMNDTIDIPVEPGRHSLQVRNGRQSSSTESFDAAEGEVVAFRCTGKRFLPIFVASFVVPRLALKLVRD
jgi:hypothetical protein